VCCWRWPRLRFEFWRRRFLKTRMVADLPWPTISAATLAPETVGAPSVTPFSPPTARTSAKATASPASPAISGTLRVSFWATLNCLPPALMIAYISVSPVPILMDRGDIAEFRKKHKGRSQAAPIGGHYRDGAFGVKDARAGEPLILRLPP